MTKQILVVTFWRWETGAGRPPRWPRGGRRGTTRVPSRHRAGLQVSLAGAQGKLEQLDAEAARRPFTVNLGMPTLADIASRTTTTSTAQHCP